ncbi:MAG: phosphopantothenoylcysteine decarboxylase [Candidatus Omnitrophica bacterium]|jgi:phosphopantothenoylcysteine synthetase/decarboxylase|nr:phosphopantothenoylcysteine decarboxylase [Candidatus Omnitrophota bacterium]
MSKKILITAGPTWIKIDNVRVITTIFSGTTGIFLAKNFRRLGYRVTLVVNSPHLDKTELNGIKVIPFKYFEDFKEKITRELKTGCYDTIIHSAAVSDYKLCKAFKGKIVSGKKSLILKLTPAEKIIKMIRKLQKNANLIQFKLEIKRKSLIKKALKSLKQNKSDFVIANALEDLKLGYKSFMIDKNGNTLVLNSKKALFERLENIAECGGS